MRVPSKESRYRAVLVLGLSPRTRDCEAVFEYATKVGLDLETVAYSND